MLLDAGVFALGCALIFLGLLMAANRAGYLVFVVGPRTVVVLAAIATLVFVAVKVAGRT